MPRQAPRDAPGSRGRAGGPGGAPGDAARPLATEAARPPGVSTAGIAKALARREAPEVHFIDRVQQFAVQQFAVDSRNRAR